MLVVSSREFREKQAEYMDMADSGEQIIVQRGKNKAYSITPITNDDIYFSKVMVEKIEKSLLQAKNGEVTKVTGKDALVEFLKDL
ncbi:type II toxin-antitoxin system prevent-host-death family antitoxin [Pedobacter sp. PF22-3]|uniref:type II toxin-antitoxin system prevent-host-death family antitoxin n=1 Tax=Pedobacter sp. PF22-3 TaxID=2994467 RepID=UPI002246A3CD|nr:type II toxin-antitoxin system prevent-host-death family antitoxin [Pedobacter sp. PF22-3]MCX2493260.1 type II toxin-antitoxin system prevent-host-death family antitoxin [Pedobacter sp. PF22-3]